MLPKILFCLFLAIDVVGVGLWFVLGLAAAGPSKTNPLAVVFTLLVVPGLLLLGAVALHQFGRSPALRLLAFLVVSAPAVVLAITYLVGQLQAGTNPGGIQGETKLTRALRELPRDPTQLPTLRALLADGADPNEAGEALPLVLAVYAAREIGSEPLSLLLDHGADPNHADAFGRPAWFAALGTTVEPAVLGLLLDRGADAAVVDRDGHSAAWAAVATQRWAAALLLVERGASVAGTSPMGRSLFETLEHEAWSHGDGDGLGPLREAVRVRTKGR